MPVRQNVVWVWLVEIQILMSIIQQTLSMACTALAPSADGTCHKHSMHRLKCLLLPLLPLLLLLLLLLPFYSSVDFVRDNPDEPLPEETFTHSQLSWSSVIPYLLHLLWSMASSQFNLRAWQSFPTIFEFSLIYLLAWHFIDHIFLYPIIVFFSQHMPIPLQPV